MVRLEENTKDDISIKDMRNGQIGIITEWNGHDKYVGRVVQRYENGLITLGKPFADSFIGILNFKNIERLRAKILPNGTNLIIEDNE